MNEPLKLTTPDTPITLENIFDRLQSGEVLITRRRLFRPSKWKQYELLHDVDIRLSNGDVIKIEKGFQWDLSSVPRFLHGILSPDGDFEAAAMIHDWLYQNKLYTRKFNDKEMLLWSNAINGNRTDNFIRWIAVRAFGWIVYRKKK